MKVLRVAGWALGALGFAGYLFERQRTQQAIEQVRQATAVLAASAARAPASEPTRIVIREAAGRESEGRLAAGSAQESGVDKELEPAEPTPQQLPDPERRAHFHRVFDREAYDAHWALDAKNKLEASIRRLNPGDADVKSLDCKRTICRAVIAVPDEDSYRKFMQTVIFASGGNYVWDGPLYASKEREEANGDWIMTVFFGERGVEF